MEDISLSLQSQTAPCLSNSNYLLHLSTPFNEAAASQSELFPINLPTYKSPFPCSSDASVTVVAIGYSWPLLTELLPSNGWSCSSCLMIIAWHHVYMLQYKIFA
jgi:hypothetical protein